MIRCLLTLLILSLMSAPALAGLTSYWSFEGISAGSSNVPESVAGNNGTFSTNPTTPTNIGAGNVSSSTPAALGASSTSFNFGGSNNSTFIDVPDTVLNNSAGSVSLWFNSPLNGGGHYAFGNQNNGSGNRVYIRTDGTNLRGSLDTPFQNFATSSIAGSQNTWQHAVMTWDNSTGDGIRYLNGSQLGSVSVNFGASGTAQFNVRIGQGGGTGSSETMQGLLDDVAIWDRALSLEEVNALENLPSFVGTLDVQDVDQLFEAHIAGGSTTVDGTQWDYIQDVSFFSGRGPGEVFSVGDGLFAVLLNQSASSGLFQPQILTPEPGSIVLFSILLTVMGGCTWWRRRRVSLG